MIEYQQSQKIELDWKTQPDNGKGASGLSDWRWEAVKVAADRIALREAPEGLDDYAASSDWMAGRIGDAEYIAAEPGQRACAARRMFAVMYVRSCALNTPGVAQPLAKHMSEFEQYLRGDQSFPELLFSVNGWSLDTLLAGDEFVDYDGPV
jgi:hypothetical protein